ncbi:MAG: SRPBCC domain-containing protein, partial [Candidatus Hydrogenedentales bacterium]
MIVTMEKSSEVTADGVLVIARVFDAPREMVWKAWTEPEQVKQWWGPEMFSAPVCTSDFRVGGKYLYCMRSPEGQDFWSTGTYEEIVPMERIVSSDSFADEKGNIISAS